MILPRHIRSFYLLLALGAAWPIGPAYAQPASSSLHDPRNMTGVWDRFPPDSFSPDATHRPPEKLYEPVLLKEPFASRYREIRDKRAAAIAAGRPLIDNQARCLPEGMPKIMAATYPIEILQTPHRVTVLAELFGQTRRIYLDEKMPNIDEIGTFYNGFSVGHWEGDTLVVETAGVRPDVEFLDIPHSKDLKITERYTLSSDDVLVDKMTMVDPSVLEKPLSLTIRYKRLPDYKISEYVCDNNHIVTDAEGHEVYDKTPPVTR